MDYDSAIPKKRLIPPILAVIGVIFAIRTVITSNKPPTASHALVVPARAPFESYAAGAGIVESSTENIAIGAPVSGLVTSVLVQPGSKVKKDDPLFMLDDRSLRAQLGVHEATLNRAKSELDRLRLLPRPEDVPPAEARVREAEGVLADALNELERRQKISDARAVSEQELSQRRYAVQVARAQLDTARAELGKLKAGSWLPDIAIAQSAVHQAEAERDSTKIELDRLTVRAPADGTVLQVKIRPGEFAQAAALANPLLLLGATDVLHLRVDVDENDAWRVSKEAPAVAFLRGNSTISAPLEFVRFEPYVIPKRSLTGESTERVDTRVLQVIYRMKGSQIPVYVGQLMDIYIQAPPAAGGPAAIGVNAPEVKR